MRVPEKPVAQPLQHMWERHKEMARRLVAGDKPGVICQEMGITPGRFSIICNSPIFSQHVNSLSEKANFSVSDIRERIFNNAPKALDILEDVMENKAQKYDAKLQVKVARDMLDRGGLGTVQKTEVMVLTGADIQKLKERQALRVVGSAVGSASCGLGLPLPVGSAE